LRAINFGENLNEEDIQRRQDMVFSQDKDIVETQRPERIPVDLRAEIHHRTDKFGVAYRRWLGALGLTYAQLDRSQRWPLSSPKSAGLPVHRMRDGLSCLMLSRR